MRKLNRKPLSDDAKRYLEKLSGKVEAAEDQKKKAISLWKSKNRDTFSEIRDTLKEMAPGLERCMYCEDSAGTDIEPVDWARALDIKVVLVAYNDDDCANNCGPIFSGVFRKCWETLGRPSNAFDLDEARSTIGVTEDVCKTQDKNEGVRG
jgi:hypothetical protein